MIEEVHKLAQPMAQPGFHGDIEYTVTGFDGSVYRFSIPHFDARKERIQIQLVSPMALSQNLNDNGEFISRDKYHVVPYYARIFPGISKHRENFVCHWPGEPKWTDWINEWNGKHYNMRLAEIVERHKSMLQGVRNIFCFALGSLQMVRDGKLSPGTFMQYLLAAKIRTSIEKLNAKTRVKIPVIAQDPEYDENCKRILAEQFRIHAVTDFQGFRSLTKDSLVISMAPSQDIIGIVCSIMGLVGPRDILCNPIDMDDKRWDGVRVPGKPWMRWDGWKGEPESEWKHNSMVEPRRSDSTTEQMAQYAMNSHREYLEDFREIAGVTKEEWDTTWGRIPAWGTTRQIYGKSHEGKKKFEKEYSVEYGEAEEVLKLGVSKFISHKEAYIGELAFYMRKSQ